MASNIRVRIAVLFGIILLLTLTVFAQRSRVLMINGKNAGPVVQMRGRSYVDIETLAENTDAAVTFQPDRIILTMPGTGNNPTSEHAPVGLSREFAAAALGAIAVGREWKSAVETMIKFQIPVTGSWLQDYRARAEEAFGFARAAATNPEDHRALQLLQTEFTTLSDWAGSAVDARQSLNATRSLSPNVLENDQVLQKINSCGQFLGNMLASGHFTDNPVCH
jgi:hypothetical protein